MASDQGCGLWTSPVFGQGGGGYPKCFFFQKCSFWSQNGANCVKCMFFSPHLLSKKSGGKWYKFLFRPPQNPIFFPAQEEKIAIFACQKNTSKLVFVKVFWLFFINVHMCAHRFQHMLFTVLILLHIWCYNMYTHDVALLRVTFLFDMGLRPP